ncbi:MAG: SIMPL domain-containing protein [Rikenellaceae bacterium]
MRKIFSLLLSIALSCSLLYGQESQGESRFIRVQGESTRSVDPNRIEINISLSEKDFEGRVSLSQMESQLAQALTESEIDASDRMKLVYQQEGVKNRRDSYSHKIYTITLHNAQEVSSLFDALKANGVFSASFGRTWHTESDSIEQSLQIEAVRAARNKAEVLAGALDQQIGLPLEIIDSGSSRYGMNDGLLLRSNSNSVSAELPSLDIKQITFRQSITVSFALQ